jgi:2-polyprenyl-3-methyl-5-hydroxy-6-metoxy-1,4-benzoquinol methylase
MKGYFDAIIMISVLQHLPNPGQVLKTCSNLLTPGGLLLITIPDSTYFRLIHRLRRLAGMESWTPFHISFFNESNLKQIFGLSGFNIIVKDNVPMLIPESIRYFGLLMKSKFVEWGMQGLCFMKADKLFRMNELLYVLEKTNVS